MHDHLTRRGVRDASEIALVMPMGVPIPPSPAASKALLAAFEERGISWHPERLVTGLDPERNVALLSDGDEMPYDLFLGVPVHRAPAVVEESGLTVDGWVPVNPLTLETSFPDVYAVGDVTSVGTPKAGVFAEGQAAVVAHAIIARARGAAPTSEYDGHGMCYLEFGNDQVARVDVTFLSGAAPVGDLEGPSSELAADKVAFGATRVQRWFGRAWEPEPTG
jgi:sulfide:quinone oxidoreductase